MLNELRRLLERNGLSLEQFLASTNQTEEGYIEEIEPQARSRVKRELVLNAIADAEGIEVSDDELRRWLDIVNASGGGKPVRLNQLSQAQRRAVANSIRRDHAMTRLFELADSANGTAASTEDAEATTVAGAVHAAQVGAEAGGDSGGTGDTRDSGEPTAPTPLEAPLSRRQAEESPEVGASTATTTLTSDAATPQSAAAATNGKSTQTSEAGASAGGHDGREASASAGEAPAQGGGAVPSGA